MSERTARAPRDELSPYQQLQNERLLATAQALHDRGMVTNVDGCSESVATIVNLTTGRHVTNAVVSHLIASLSSPESGGPPPLYRTGTTDMIHPEKSETNGVCRGDLTVFCDENAIDPKIHIGIASAIDEHHHVVAVLSNSSSARAFVQTLPGFGNSVRLEHYRLPATPENVRFMLHHVPELPDRIALDPARCTIVPLDRSVPRPIDVPPHDYTKPKDGWQLPGLTRSGDGSIAPTAENQFRSITLREAIYRAERGHVFKHDFSTKAARDPVSAGQNETLERAVFSHLPADRQSHYRNAMKIDGPTTDELRAAVGTAPDHELKDAVNRIQLAIVRAERGGPAVQPFEPRPPALDAEQAETLNRLMREAVVKHAPHHEETSSNGVTIRPAPPNFTYAGRVDSVDSEEGTFVLSGGRNDNQAFAMRAADVGGILPGVGDRVLVRPGAIEPATATKNVGTPFAR
jgi:hypothetical protein